MSGFEVQGPKSDDSDSLGLKNGLYPIMYQLQTYTINKTKTNNNQSK